MKANRKRAKSQEKLAAIELPVAGDAGATAGASDACTHRGGRAEQFFYVKVIYFKICPL